MLVISNEFKAMVICGCAASIKNSKGLKIKGLKIVGVFPVDVLRWSQVVKILPGAGMKISALKSQWGFFRGHMVVLSPDLIY